MLLAASRATRSPFASFFERKNACAWLTRRRSSGPFTEKEEDGRGSIRMVQSSLPARENISPRKFITEVRPTSIADTTNLTVHADQAMQARVEGRQVVLPAPLAFACREL